VCRIKRPHLQQGPRTALDSAFSLPSNFKQLIEIAYFKLFAVVSNFGECGDMSPHSIDSI